MLIQEKIKIAAFGAMGLAFVYLAYGLNKKSDQLDKALIQIDSARASIHSARCDMDTAKFKIEVAQKILADMRLAAQHAQEDLNNLKEERKKISLDIDKTLAGSRQKLKAFDSSVETLLDRQKDMLHALDAVGIRSVYIESSNKK